MSEEGTRDDLIVEELGATGEYPEGKINSDDEGELRFAVGHDPKTGQVFIEFGVPVQWIAMGSEQALGLCFAILEHAMEVAE